MRVQITRHAHFAPMYLIHFSALLYLIYFPFYYNILCSRYPLTTTTTTTTTTRAGYHFSACQHIPQTVRDEFARLTSGKRHVSSRASQAYWIKRGLDVGLVDVAVETAADASVAAGSTAEDEEGGGIYFKDDAERLGLTILPPTSSGRAKKKTSSSTTSAGGRRASASSAANTRPPKKAKAERGKQDASLAVSTHSNGIPQENRQQQPSAGTLAQLAQAQVSNGASTLEALLGIISASSQHQNMAIPTAQSSVPAPAPVSLASSAAASLDGSLLDLPTHSIEDEQRELASLSVAELAGIQSDVNGLPVPTFNLGSLDLPLALTNLNQEMSNLPATETAAYHRAVELCPDQVSYDRKLIFLEHENGDACLAAKTMSGYWTHRVQLFGPDKAFLPMTLSGAMKDEVLHMSNRRLWEMVPVTDTAGRTILYHTPSRRDFSQYTFEQEMRAMWYLFESVIEDGNSRKNGVVILVDLRGYSMSHYTLKIATLFSPILSVLPTRVRAIHACYPNLIVNALLPLSKKFMEKRLRLRLVVHQPPPMALLASLNRYCIPMDRIPVDLGVGGSVVLNTSSWMLSRMTLENSRQNQSLGPLVTTAPATGSVAAAVALLLSQQASALPPIVERSGQPLTLQAASKLPGPINHVQIPTSVDASPFAKSSMSKKSRIMKRMESPEESTACPDKYSHLNDKDLYERIMKERRRTGVGRKADPRMDEAVLACLGDSSLSRMDALSLGGFNFTERNAEDSHNSKDADGIAFHQRRDQLNRRLRQAQVCFPYFAHFAMQFWRLFRYLPSPFVFFSKYIQGYIKAARSDCQKYNFEDSSEMIGG